MRRGRVPGLLCLVSSRRYPGQFTDRKETERRRQLAETGQTSIYLYDRRLWDVKPAGTYSGETFEVFQGDVSRMPRVLTDGEHVPESGRDLVIEVPVEHRADFEGDLLNALRDIAGVSTVAVHPFLVNRDAVAACFDRHPSILTRDAVTWPDESLQGYAVPRAGDRGAPTTWSTCRGGRSCGGRRRRSKTGGSRSPGTRRQPARSWAFKVRFTAGGRDTYLRRVQASTTTW